MKNRTVQDPLVFGFISIKLLSLGYDLRYCRTVSIACYDVGSFIEQFMTSPENIRISEFGNFYRENEDYTSSPRWSLYLPAE